MIVDGIEVKTIPGFPNYAITKDGRVWSKPRPRTRGGWKKLTLTGGGYLQVKLSNNGKNYFPLVHRLVLETYIGPCPPGMECRHLNDIKIDNDLGNLRWGTRKENSADAIRNDVHPRQGPRGEKSATAKLTEVEVREIVELYNSGKYPKAALGRAFCVTAMNIKHIVNKESWKHLWTN